MPEMTEAELATLEAKAETVRLLRLQKEEENAALNLELDAAKAQLADIQMNKGDFESKLESLDADADGKREAMKQAEKRRKRDVEDFKNDLEATKQAAKDQMRQLNKERLEAERKVKESLDDLAVMEFKVASASQDIDNMLRRIDVQKEQWKTSQKFVDKLEKERREVESMYEKLRVEHDLLRDDNQRAEMENVEAQLKLSPEGRHQYLQEAAKREERRPMTPSQRRRAGGGGGGRRARRGAREEEEYAGSVYSGGEELEEEDDDDAFSVVSSFSRRGSSYSAVRHRRESSEERERYDRVGGIGVTARGRRHRADVDADYDFPPAAPPRRRSLDSCFSRESSLRPRGKTEREMSVLSARAARLARESAETGSKRGVVVGADGEPELGRGLSGLREFMMTTTTSTMAMATRRKLRGPRDSREMSEF